MKKATLLTLLVLLIPFSLFAPDYESEVKENYVIESNEKESQPTNPYQKMIYAIGMVECSLDTLAYNPDEDAVGYFQIRPIRLQDYNKRTGSNYTLQEMYDYYKAEKVFLYYAELLKDPDLIIRKWNGSGPMTYEYLKKVKKYML